MSRVIVEGAEGATAQTEPASQTVVEESLQREVSAEEMPPPTTLVEEGSERGTADSLPEGEAQLVLLPSKLMHPRWGGRVR
jgi:hypothetical protein